MRHLLLCLAIAIAPVAAATPVTPAIPATNDMDADVEAARAKTCAAFLSEVTRHGGSVGETPSFALVWGWLLKRDQAAGGGLGKIAKGKIMFENTEYACQRMRGRTLGATMDAEFAQL